MNSKLIKIRNIILMSVAASFGIGGACGLVTGFYTSVRDVPYCWRNHCKREQLRCNGEKDTIGQSIGMITVYSIGGMTWGILWPICIYGYYKGHYKFN